MSQPQHELPSEWEALNNDCIVYRAVLNGPHREKVSGRILSNAFLRRKPKDGTLRDGLGLSVYLFLDERLDEDQIGERIRADLDCCAIGSLQVGEVRGIEATPRLDVVRDSENHANITNLPAYGENDAEAEHLATQLAKLTTTMWWK